MWLILINSAHVFAKLVQKVFVQALKGEALSGSQSDESLLTSAATGLGCFKINFDRFAIEVSAIEAGNSSTCFMTFHFDKAEAFALSGKDIGDQFE